MRTLVFILLASCVVAPRYETPRYEPFYSPVDGQWHPAPPHCDGIPLVNRYGAVTGCYGERRAPVYECAAEDGSGRTVRVAYAGDPVRLSEDLADEPGGLWSCWPAGRSAEHASAAATLLDLRSAAELANAASCSPYPWRPLRLQECR